MSKRRITNRLFSLIYYPQNQRHQRLVSFLTLTSTFIGLFLIFTCYTINNDDLTDDDDKVCRSEAEKNFVSMCSCSADRRGLHQNVIAFSLYGNFSDANHFTRYVDPIRILLANISQVYPGKKMSRIIVFYFK